MTAPITVLITRRAAAMAELQAATAGANALRLLVAELDAIIGEINGEDAPPVGLRPDAIKAMAAFAVAAGRREPGERDAEGQDTAYRRER